MQSLSAAVSLESRPAVQTILRNQGLLDDQQRCRRILQHFGNEEFAHRLEERWAKRPEDSATRWEELVAEADKASKVQSANSPNALVLMPLANADCNGYIIRLP